MHSTHSNRMFKKSNIFHLVQRLYTIHWISHNILIISYLLLYSLWLLITFASSDVWCSTFYPFGTAVRDLSLRRVDDSFESISIMFDFPFFGNIYRQLFISTNGIITFGGGTSVYVPRPFPLSDLQGVAAYWTDSDPSRGGNIFYRKEFSPNILKQITDDVRSRFVQHSGFSSSWALVVTFSNVSAFGCGTGNGCTSACSAVVNHQTILTSDGINSFAIFLYNRLDYTAGVASCSAYAQIGFNAGDGKRFYLVPSSNTPNIPNVALADSNVGIPSKWMFSIGEDISGVCNIQGLLAINPRKVFYFGNQDILITGPCFTANETRLTVYFDHVPVNCEVLGGFQMNCSVPLLDRTGRISVVFHYQNMIFNSFLISTGLEDDLLTDAVITTVETDPDAKFTMRWNPALLGNLTSLTIRGYQVDISIDSNGNVETVKNTAVVYTDISNIGQAELTPNIYPRSRRSSGGQLIRQMMLLVGRTTVSVPVLVGFGLSQLYCSTWYSLQPSQQDMKKIVDEVARRSPCPPGVSPDFPTQMPNFKIDDSCNPNNPGMCNFFHRGAKGCYRSTNNADGHASQCCYNDRNELIIGPPGGGTLDWVDSDESRSGHFKSDVLPYIACCKLSVVDQCDKYYEKRPSIDSWYYVPPRPVWANGDPHFITMDGTAYNFNPVGEFIYLKSRADEVQARISQYTSSSGRQAQACYFSAFAIKSNSSETIQVELNALQTFTIKASGELLTLDQGSLNFGNIYLNLVDQGTISVQTKTGINLEISIISRMLHLIISIPEEFKGTVSGLVGNWDDNPENDLMLPDGAWIPRNSSNRDVHFNFGMKWSTTNQTSLFSYSDGLTWRDYQDASFLPSFSVPPANPACGNNTACLYDVFVTGDRNVGLSNIAIQNRTREIVSLYDQISTTCSSQVSVSNADVSVNNDTSSPGSLHYTIRCYSGFQLVGSGDVTCTSGNYSAPFGVCDRATTTTGSTAVAFVEHEILIRIDVCLNYYQDLMW